MLRECTLSSFTVVRWAHVSIFEIKKLNKVYKRVARLNMVV